MANDRLLGTLNRRPVVRRIQDGEADNLVPLAESPCDRVGRPGHERADRTGQPFPRQSPEHEPGVLDRLGVGGAAPEGDPQCLADLVAGALGVGVGLRRRQGGDGVDSREDDPRR